MVWWDVCVCVCVCGWYDDHGCQGCQAGMETYLAGNIAVVSAFLDTGLHQARAVLFKRADCAEDDLGLPTKHLRNERDVSERASEKAVDRSPPTLFSPSLSSSLTHTHTHTIGAIYMYACTHTYTHASVHVFSSSLFSASVSLPLSLCLSVCLSVYCDPFGAPGEIAQLLLVARVRNENRKAFKLAPWKRRRQLLSNAL